MSVNASIVENRIPESTIAKVQFVCEGQVTVAQTKSLRHLMPERHAVGSSALKTSEPTSFEEKVLKILETSSKVVESHYTDLCFIPATSNISERLFRKADRLSPTIGRDFFFQLGVLVVSPC